MELYNDDCLSILKKEIKDESLDLVVTSPPYDNLRTYDLENISVDYKELANELYRCMKLGGVITWVVQDQTIKGNKTLSSFRQAIIFQEAGFNVHDVMIWRKDTSAFPGQRRYANVFEYIFVFSKGKPKTFNPIKDRPNKSAGDTIHGTGRNSDGTIYHRSEKSETWCGKLIEDYGVRFNVWDIPTEKRNKTGHPAVFPLRLAKDLITSFSNEGDVVADIFMGSGTTGLACQELNRNFIGIEINKDYFDIATNRLNNNKQIIFDI